MAARNAENAASHHFDDFAECADIGNEFAYFQFRADKLDDVARRIGGQHLTAGTPYQSPSTRLSTPTPTPIDTEVISQSFQAATHDSAAIANEAGGLERTRHFADRASAHAQHL